MKLSDRYFLWVNHVCRKHLVLKESDTSDGYHFCPLCGREKDINHIDRLRKLGVKV